MHGYVIYPDGGCRGQHEYGGAGIHGYRWNLDLTPKGIGHTTHSATFEGYCFKADSFEFDSKEKRAEVQALSKKEFLDWVDIETAQLRSVPTEKEKKNNSFVPEPLKLFSTRVPVEQYYDCSIPLAYGGTNNTAELLAAIHCLERIQKEPDFDEATMIVIRQDSQYVVEGNNLYLHNWMASNFKRRDGSSIRNPELWVRFSELVNAISEKGIKVIFKWVSAHDTDIGNNSADVLATMGLFISKDQKAVAAHDDQFKASSPTGYWTSNSELRHPMMCQRYCFNDIASERPLVNQYYLSTQGKAEEMTGKRTADDGFSIVRCAKQSHIEEVIAKQLSIPREIDYKFNIDLDSVYGADSRYVGIYGTDFLHRALEHKRHLQTYGEVLMTKELHPPFLTERLFDNIDILSVFLEDFKKTDQPTMLTTDITDYFYTTTEQPVKVKKGEEARVTQITSLKSEIVVGYFKQQVMASWKNTPTDIQECEITLRLGIDLPERNALRKLEESNPRVSLLTHTLGEGSFMYAVIIEAGEDIGIWSGINSSIRVIAKKPNKANKETKPA